MPDASVPRGVSRPSDQAARRAWLAAQRPAYVPHPEPEVRARPAQPDEIPTGAKRLVKAAEANDWQARVWYARGTTMTARGAPGRVVDSVLVSLARAGRGAAVACWEDGKFDFAYAGLGPTPAHKIGARQLKQLVEALPDDDKEAA